MITVTAFPRSLLKKYGLAIPGVDKAHQTVTSGECRCHPGAKNFAY